jgi:hypothetical protein
MQTTTGTSYFQMTMRENQPKLSNQELFGTMVREVEKTDWDMVIVKIDKQISRAGAVSLTVSALYFSFIFISMFLG